MEKIKNFKDLRIWQLGKDISITIYKATNSFPKTEQYGLSNQMRRCAISIPSNIAEGFNRFSRKEYVQFLYIALGSCSELETQIIISNELGYFNNTKDLINKTHYVSKAIRKLISVITSSK